MAESAFAKELREGRFTRPRRLVYPWIFILVFFIVFFAIIYVLAAGLLWIDIPAIAFGIAVIFIWSLLNFLYLRARIKSSEVIEGKVMVKTKLRMGTLILISYALNFFLFFVLFFISHSFFNDNVTGYVFSFALGTLTGFGIVFLPLIFQLESKFGKIYVLQRL